MAIDHFSEHLYRTTWTSLSWTRNVALLKEFEKTCDYDIFLRGYRLVAGLIFQNPKKAFRPSDHNNDFLWTSYIWLAGTMTLHDKSDKYYSDLIIFSYESLKLGRFSFHMNYKTMLTAFIWIFPGRIPSLSCCGNNIQRQIFKIKID